MTRISAPLVSHRSTPYICPFAHTHITIVASYFNSNQKLNTKPLPLTNSITTLLDSTRPPINSPTTLPPQDIILPKLYKYQQQALAWMIEKETVLDRDSTVLSPLWEALHEESTGRHFYLNVLSATLTFKRYTTASEEPGGALCEEMGECGIVFFVVNRKKAYHTSFPQVLERQLRFFPLSQQTQETSAARTPRALLA